MPEMESGTIAAAVPIEVPTIRRVNGIKATRRMMNGNERKPFTIAPITRLTQRFSHKPPGDAPTRMSPSGSPTAKLIEPDTAVITSVSPSEPARRSSGKLSMAKNLHRRPAELKMALDQVDKVGRRRAHG